MELEIASGTHIGRQRAINQDVAHAETFQGGAAALLVVADGLGGHAAGEVASQTAVKLIVERTRSRLTDPGSSNADIAAALTEMVGEANSAVADRAATNIAWVSMGTTLVVAWIAGQQAFVANVGDSRAYLQQAGRLAQLTTDHSWVEEEITAGRLTREEARVHPRRNVITRSLGLHERVEVDIVGPVELKEGDRMLLCSDGLHGVVDEDSMARILRDNPPAGGVDQLIRTANEAGGPDNIAVAIARLVDAA